jgi:hypothetical protein
LILLTTAPIVKGFGAAGIMSVNAALVPFIFPNRLLGAAWDPMRWWWHTTMLGIPIVNPVEAANISDQLSAAGFLNGLA